MYVAVKGGETAVKNSRRLVAKARRGDEALDEIQLDQIQNQMGLALDRVMAEGALYDTLAAAAAIRQAQGDLTEAAFLVRAYRTTLPRFGNSNPVATNHMRLSRRISSIFKDIPGGQVLGPTYDYTHRLIEFDQASQQEPPGSCHNPFQPGSVVEKRSNDITVIHEKFRPWVKDLLIRQGLMPDSLKETTGKPIGDLTRRPLKIPAGRDIRLQNMARGDEGFLLASAYSLQRGFGAGNHPFLGELRVGFVSLVYTPPELGFDIEIGEVKMTECHMVNRFYGNKEKEPGFENGYGLVFGQNERKAMSIALLDRSLTGAEEEESQIKYPAQDQEFILAHSDNVESSGFVQHLKLPHYVDFQSELVVIRNLRKAYHNTVK